MIDFFVTVSIEADWPEETECLPLQLSGLPHIGETVFPDAALQELMEKKRKAWDFSEEVRLNYVRNILHRTGYVPLLVLGPQPGMTIISPVLNDKLFPSVLVRHLPLIGDRFCVAGNFLRVKDLCHGHNDNVVIELSDSSTFPRHE